MRKYALSIGLASFACLYPVENRPILDTIQNSLAVPACSIVVATAGINLAQSAQLYICPNKHQQYQAEQVAEQIHFLKTEEEFKKCLVHHARDEQADSKFPVKCRIQEELFTLCAGYEHLNSIKKEFAGAVNSLPLFQASTRSKQDTGISTVTKGILIAGGAGLVILAAPIVFPGTIIAAKAAALTASVKGLAVTAGTKVAAGAAASKTMVAGAAATVLEVGASISVESVIHAVTHVPAAATIINTAQVVQQAKLVYTVSEIARPYVFQTAREELIYLYKIRASCPSLAERIHNVHTNVS